MPRLPVLTAANALTEPHWHAYIRRVYHQPIEGDMVVDLNTFGWFWRGAADHAADGPVNALLSETPCLSVCSLDMDVVACEGTLWHGDQGPEDVRSMGGFFVARPFLLPSSVPACDVLEVAHHINDSWENAEVGVSWFYHAPGSGVFLDCHELPRRDGRIVAYTRRTDFPEVWDQSMDGPVKLATYMDRENIAMIVFTEADYSNQRQVLGGNPRTEIIVRQNQAVPPSDWFGGYPEGGLPHRACLTDDEIGMRFHTGFGGARPCACDATVDFLNCNESG